MKTLYLTLAFILLLAPVCRGQILISLIFGDKLNSDKLEFGLDGGLSLSTINGIAVTEMRSDFNLGSYFYFK